MGPNLQDIFLRMIKGNAYWRMDLNRSVRHIRDSESFFPDWANEYENEIQGTACNQVTHHSSPAPGHG
jgi:hypothetical protein